MSGEHKGKEVELPTNSVLAFPTWLQGYGVKEPPVLSQEYLVVCDGDKCG